MKMGIFVAANCFAGWDVSVNIESYERGEGGEQGWGRFARVLRHTKREGKRDLFGEDVMLPKKDRSPRPGGTSQRQSPPTARRASWWSCYLASSSRRRGPAWRDSSDASVPE